MVNLYIGITDYDWFSFLAAQDGIDQLEHTEAAIAALEKQLMAWHKTNAEARLLMPSFIAMASAVLKPMPRMSRASRYGFSVMTWMASAP